MKRGKKLEVHRIRGSGRRPQHSAATETPQMLQVKTAVRAGFLDANIK